MSDEAKLLRDTNPAIAQEPNQRNLVDPVATTAATEAAAKAPRLKVVQVGKKDFEIHPDCKDGAHVGKLLRTAVGAGDQDFLDGIVRQLAKVCSGDGGVNEA